MVHTLHWVGEGLHTGPHWVGEGCGPHWSSLVHTGPHWSTLVHSGLVKDGSFGFVTEPQLSGLSPTDALGKGKQYCRSIKSTTSIEKKTITMDPNGFFNVHRSRASGQSTETLVDCVNEGAGYNNSLRQRRTLLTSASQASGSIQSTRRKVCFKIKMNWLSNVVCLQVLG